MWIVIDKFDPEHYCINKQIRNGKVTIFVFIVTCQNYYYLTILQKQHFHIDD